MRKVTLFYNRVHPETKPETVAIMMFWIARLFMPIALANLGYSEKQSQALIIPLVLQVWEGCFSRDFLPEDVQVFDIFLLWFYQNLAFLQG